MATRSGKTAIVLLAALLATAIGPAAAAQITVTNTADAGAGSLRAAITAANAAPGSTITFTGGGPPAPSRWPASFR